MDVPAHRSVSWRRLCLAAVWVGGFTLTPIAAGEVVYFVVAEFPGHEWHNDSYVIALADPDDIAHARDLIEFGPEGLSAIVSAEIDCGPDGINRDELATGRPLWSWHITAVSGFCDVSAEIYDGWPTYVEENLDLWMYYTGGRIAFWTYTVVAELPPPDYGDLNCDGVVDFDDIDPFVAALTDVVSYASDYPGCQARNADLSGDGRVDFDDIDPFVEALSASQ